MKKIIDYCVTNIDKKDKITNYIKIIERIKRRHIEPEFFYIILTNYLFKCKLTLFFVDGDLSKCYSNYITFEDEEQKEEIPSINIGCFYYGYFPLYSSQFAEELNNIINNNIPKIQRLTYIHTDKEGKECEICNKPLETIWFLQKKFRCCYLCLKEYLHNVLVMRAKEFVKLNYIGLECKLHNII